MSSFEASTLHRLLLAVILSIVLFLGYKVLSVFFIPIAWAGVLAYVTWPAYTRLLAALGQRHNSAAILMTFALALLIIIPMLLAVIVLNIEAANVYHMIEQKIVNQNLVLPEFAKKWPFAHELQKILDQLMSNPETFKELISV